MADSTELAFTIVGDGEADDLAAGLAGETWPFHARSRWSVADALASIRDGDSSGTNPTYWVDLEGRRIGIVHYRYLEDVTLTPTSAYSRPSAGGGTKHAWSSGQPSICSRPRRSTVSPARRA